MNRFGLKAGQWTDDSSMALCLADSLIKHSNMIGVDFRSRLLTWWYGGYNNAFRLDNNRSDTGSVGLGGNISQSFMEFIDQYQMNQMQNCTKAGHPSNTSGNGSIIRNAPLPVFFSLLPPDDQLFYHMADFSRK